jgi:DNA-binding NtrC family response regulator
MVADSSTQQARVLVVDDEIDMAESCSFFLKRAGHLATVATTGEQALALLKEAQFDLVVTDVRLPRVSGLQLLDAIKSRDPDIEVLVVTGFPEIEAAVRAIKSGAFDYLQKPFSADAFMERVDKALAHRRLKATNPPLRERLRRGERGVALIHRSESFGRTVELLERAARTDASVLIHGESGTGKELLAHHLHAHSARAGRPFVPVDCTTIPESLVESELFGHVKGAFSGADQNRPGLFEVASGGTLFLDEVGELPLAFQPKLLRAIQERQVRRVGAVEYRAADVRLVCATNRDLRRMVDAGTFRQDLFYRLDVVRIDVPPLRERRGDVEVLARHFLTEMRERHGSKIVEIAPDALAVLAAYHWPGNVRQLRNCIERASALATGSTLGVADLPDEVTDRTITGAPARTGAGPDVAAFGELTFQELKARTVAELEHGYLAHLLRKHAGNVTHCAEEAGMARSAFQKLMQRYGIRSSDYRD